MRQYTANVHKALEVILWFAAKSPEIDVYRVVKGAFFADKFHIQEFGRPIIGDQYRAAPWGPLPQVVYSLIQRHPLEVQALQTNGEVPIRLRGEYNVIGERAPNLYILSESDVGALEHGWHFVKDKTFDELYDLTHAEEAYILANGGVMDYRYFLDKRDAQYKEKAAYLEEVAPYAVL